MGRRREDFLGVLAWLGITGGAERLTGDVVVVSPHLDDAVFSLGAAISHATRRGTTVKVLTVLAGDPESEQAAGPWDRRVGHRTAGESARVRRQEDLRACAILGACPLWLPYSDDQYERGADDASIRAEVVDAVGDATVLLPGAPLTHEDHAWLARLLEDAFDPERLGYYVEQPYGLWTSYPDRNPGGDTQTLPGHGWRRAAAGPRDRARKVRACRAYASQVPFLGSRMIFYVCGREARLGGELIAWRHGETAFLAASPTVGRQ
jgi:LmbE family N-acetylglucosaminyl deacetylase